MKKLWALIANAGLKMGARAKLLWSRVGFKSTSKIAAWASKNKGWLQTVGLTSLSAGAGALTSSIVSNYISTKEEVANRWMEQTGESTPERASWRKKIRVQNELRDKINKFASYSDSDKDDEYLATLIRILELVNYLIHNESDDEVRRVAIRASIVIPGCMEAGQVPEEGFANPLVLRTLRQLSEDSLSAEDIEGMLDCVLDVAESGSPLKSI